MSEERFDHMEGMLTQLITTVGKMREQMEEMKSEQEGMKNKQDEMQNEFTAFRKEQTGMKKEQSEMKQNIFFLREDYQDMRMENNDRHAEVMRKFRAIESDQEFVWKKAVQNEREIAKVKSNI